ncbi:MAG TPA: amidohydrolase family protein [Blastocatellia bacterium]|nr:amidohydrolase family protein [Blastocatellia bacterium]
MQIESPGFFDLQVNGFAGVDFNDPDCTAEQVQYAVAAMRATGVTRLLPTLVTSSFESFARCARTLVNCHDVAIAGLHMEGPYISPVDGARGAHSRAHTTRASIDDFRRRQEAASGRIVLVTLAPEVEGAIALTEHLAGSGVRVAIGHTSASPEQIRDAIRAGATLSTHLGNGCANLLPRHPNFIWEQLAADDLMASFIVDGHHLPPATVKAMIRAKTPARAILVTDAIAAAGCAPGKYVLGETTVELSADGRVAEPGTSWLAGSALMMNRAVANTVKFTGVSLHEVLLMASTLPAQYLGFEPAGRVVAEWDQEAGSLLVKAVTG